MKIALISQKGGQGKSSLTRHLAVEYMRRGRRTVIFDADRQKTVVGWWQTGRKRGYIVPNTLEITDEEDLVRRANEISGGYDLSFIDTPGAIYEKKVGAALMLADLVIIPVVPDPDDVRAFAETAAVIKTALSVRPRMGALVVLNKVDAKSVLYKPSLAAIQRSGLPLANTQLGQYRDYAKASGVGQGVTTFAPKSTGAAQLCSLANEVERLFPAAFPSLPGEVELKDLEVSAHA
jgi:chromosome partitioning protein